MAGISVDGGQVCQCCGLLTLPSFSSYDVCPVCFWQDDPVQNDDCSYGGGTNGISLHQARQNWVDIGAAQRQYLDSVRPPEATDLPPSAARVGLDAEGERSRRWRVGARLLAVVRGILASSIGITEGSHLLVSISYEPGASWRSEMIVFEGIASETDDLPVGTVRQFWNPDALASKDLERTAYEARMRGRALEACRSLAKRLSEDPTSKFP